MEQGQTSFRNDFEREFWAKVYAASVGTGTEFAVKAADAALGELRKRQASIGNDWAVPGGVTWEGVRLRSAVTSMTSDPPSPVSRTGTVERSPGVDGELGREVSPGSWRGKEDSVEDRNERLLDEIALNLGDKAMATPGVGSALARCLGNSNPINERRLLTCIIRNLCDDIQKMREAQR